MKKEQKVVSQRARTCLHPKPPIGFTSFLFSFSFSFLFYMLQVRAGVCARTVIYMTLDDEREAHVVAEELWARRRKALVVRVWDLHHMGLPTPRTTDRWAVITNER